MVLVEFAAPMPNLPRGEVEAMPISPPAVIVVVAEPPNFAFAEDKKVEEANKNCWSEAHE